jgi:hypothetical protein
MKRRSSPRPSSLRFIRPPAREVGGGSARCVKSEPGIRGWPGEAGHAEPYHGCAWGRDSYALMVTSEHVFVSAFFQRDLRSLKDIRAGRVSWNVPSEAWANDRQPIPLISSWPARSGSSFLRWAAVPHSALRATLPTNGKWARDKKAALAGLDLGNSKNSEPCWPPTGTIAAVTRHRTVGGCFT